MSRDSVSSALYTGVSDRTEDADLAEHRLRAEQEAADVVKGALDQAHNDKARFLQAMSRSMVASSSAHPGTATNLVHKDAATFSYMTLVLRNCRNISGDMPETIDNLVRECPGILY